MNRIARCITVAVLLAVGLATLSSCRDSLFEPKKFFYGVIKNVTQWLLYVPHPANMADVYELSPNEYFSAELEGSKVHHFEAKLPDGAVYASFDARINQLSGDAPINGVNVDWAWVIGGPFMACVTPVRDGDQYSVTVESSRPDLPAPLVLMVDRVELQRVKNTTDPRKLVETITEIARRHGVSDPHRVFPAQEVK